VNSDAEGEGWFFRLELDDPDSFETLMDQDAYDEFLETL
jgi:glycine cleavage system H protein